MEKYETFLSSTQIMRSQLLILSLTKFINYIVDITVNADGLAQHHPYGLKALCWARSLGRDRIQPPKYPELIG
jgi:hypothetical protein